MKNLQEFLENKVDDTIDSTLKMFQTTEDIEALGEAFGAKYEKNLFDALVEFLDGVEIPLHDSKLQKKITDLRVYISKL